MLSPQIEKALAQAELRFNALSDAIVSGDLTVLELASEALRQTSVELSGVLQRLEPAVLRQQSLKIRLKRIAQGMQQQREALIRRTVNVERGLRILLPDTHPAATYAQASGPYQSSGKSSGAFKLLVA
jgi:hypothetical protein